MQLFYNYSRNYFVFHYLDSMEYISSVNNYIRALVARAPPECGNILSALYQRADIIAELSNIKKELDYINAKLSADIDKLNNSQHNELAKVSDALLYFKNEKVTIPQIKIDENWDQRADVPIDTVVSANIPREIPIKKELSLPAVAINNFDEVRAEGVLYYINCADHFAIKLNGVLLHGNIGNILVDEKSPYKIKNCKFLSKCLKKDSCDYYHDPLEHAGSTDRRNYFASSWVYQSSYASKYRKFGSYSKLEQDIWTVTRDDIDRFRDQVMHDLLCVLLLLKYHK